jgi:hypothetical protein
MPEEVEVGRVEMAGNVEAISALSCARPAVFDASEAAKIEVYGAFGYGLLLQDPRVEDRGSDEEERGSEKPADGKAMRPEIEPDHDDLQNGEDEAKVAEAEVNSFEVGDPELASALPLKILIRWQRWVRHRAIITR